MAALYSDARLDLCCMAIRPEDEQGMDEGGSIRALMCGYY